MENSSNQPINSNENSIVKKEDLSHDKKLRDSGQQENIKLINSESKNNFENDSFVTLIVNPILQFLEKKEQKYLSLCNKKIYKLYCSRVKKLKIRPAMISKSIFNKYENFISLDLSKCLYIFDFSFISNLEKLEILNVSNTYITDISFLERNKNIKDLDLYDCMCLRDFTPIFHLEKLEILNISYTNIDDISFLVGNKNLKEFYLYDCTNIKDFKPLFNLEKLEKFDVSNTYISDISFLDQNKNIKELYLAGCENIKDFIPISKFIQIQKVKKRL